MWRLRTGTIFSIVPYRLNNYASFMSQSKLTNTVRKLLLVTPQQAEVPTNGLYIDIAQCLSIVNRKSYRQGMNYAIAGFTIYSGGSGGVFVQTLPKHWTMDNATTKMFETWKDQRAEVLKESPSLKAKWSDFKVFMDADHAAAGVAGNITPVAYSNGAYQPYLLGEWAASEITTPVDGGAIGISHQSTVHVIGDNVPPGAFQPGATTSIGAIREYAASRAIIMSPDPVPQPGTASNLTVYNVLSSHDEMSEAILNDITFQNDTPPYDRDNYPGGPNQPYLEFVDLLAVNNYGDASAGSKASSGPFVAPLGLINVIPSLSNNANMVIEIDLVPGNYKGVLAERGL